MEGLTLAAGAVGQYIGIRNPIRLARKVLHSGQQVLLIREGALSFASSTGGRRKSMLQWVGLPWIS
jgi:beta-aspartyl-peptidase (threonine type)